MTKWIAFACAAALFTTGCDSKTNEGKAGDKGSASADASANEKGDGAKKGEAGAGCKKYVAFLDKCLAQVPDEQKPPLEETRNKYKKLIDDGNAAQLKQMDQSCLMGLAQTKKDVLCKDVE